jgi:hypothetical protein
MTKGRMLRTKLAVIALLFSAICFATPKSLDLGGLVLSVSDAPTAQIFHIVDQLSQWDVYTHKQYVRWAETTKLLDQRDRELLQLHAELRKKRGWGHGFEQTFLVDDSIENAAAKGTAAQFLSTAEAIPSATSSCTSRRSCSRCCASAKRKSPRSKNSW